ncbi:MAG: hypothetical protein GX621_14740 [Pirellulaceae bacterium]|nr:hypothetical protein [Pirellulaceae bacterium]
MSSRSDPNMQNANPTEAKRQGTAVLALFAAAVLVAVISIVWRHGLARRGVGPLSGEEVFLTSLLLAMPALALIASILMLRTEPRNHLVSGLLAGSFAGSSSFLLLPAWFLITRYGTIAHDSTAYWDLLLLPSLCIGLPLVLASTVFGAFGGLILGPANSDASTSRRRIASGCLVVLGVAMAAVALCCVSSQRQVSTTAGLRLSLVDATSGKPIRDADVFLVTILEATGHGPLWESHWRQIHYEYTGRQKTMLYFIPTRSYRTLSYNFALWRRRPARCYSAVVFHKRGYLTKVWTPDTPTQVELLRLADSHLRDTCTGEGTIDFLFDSIRLAMPGECLCCRVREDEFIIRAEVLQEAMPNKSDFRRIAEFAAVEYQAILDANASLDETTRKRLSKKIEWLTGLSPI